MATLILLSAPSDIDTAAGKRNAGIAGEFLNDLLYKYAPEDTAIEYRYVSEVNRTHVFTQYTHVLVVGTASAKYLDCEHYLYTYRRGIAKIISVPEHTIAVDLRQQAYDEEEDEDDAGGDQKEVAPTRATNYAYWIEEGIKKLYQPTRPVRLPMVRSVPTRIEIERFLTEASVLFLDIETRRNQDVFSGAILDCIGVGRDCDDLVLVIPIYNYDHNLAYPLPILLEILYTLSAAAQSKTIVAHNAMFDLTVLSLFAGFRIPLIVHDTMLMHHRLASEVEKSLGHLIGQYTDQPYHKHEIVVPHNSEQEKQLHLYNAKDVLGTKMVYYAMLKEIEKDEGLISAFRVSSDSIPTYLEMQARGMEVDQDALDKTIVNTGFEVSRMEELVNILAGQELNVGSTQQLVEFFHECHGYKVVGRSKLTGKPALGKKQLQQLAVRTGNPLIPLVINTKKLRKSESMLTFKSL